MKIAKTHAIASLVVALLAPARAQPPAEPARLLHKQRGAPPMRLEGGAGLPGVAPGPGTQVLHVYLGKASRRHRPWVATLCAAGITLVAGVVTGGLALERARSFAQRAAAGASADELLQPRGQARQLAFATDLLLGTAAVGGAVTLVLRFGTGTSRPPEPVSLEQADAGAEEP
ncbi:MAG: hypothetical protein RMK29_14220 [Myxococcales bacterium]|nr:hypothetical protein [Myxococcales bacterium]